MGGHKGEDIVERILFFFVVGHFGEDTVEGMHKGGEVRGGMGEIPK